MKRERSKMCENADVKEKTPCVRQRYVLAGLGFMGMFFVGCLRNCVNVAVLSMVRWNATSNVTSDKQLTFAWSSRQEGLFLGSYFYGYMAGNFLGGYFGKKFGFRKVFGIPLLLSSAMSVVTPMAAYTSFVLALVCRIFVGLMHSIAIAAFMTIWRFWAPPLERSSLHSIALCGIPFGTGLVYLFAGWIAQNIGWEAVFYILGSIGLCFSIFWLFYVAETPREHRWISQSEIQYIEHCIGGTKQKRDPAIPWLAMLKSRSVWAIIVISFCDNWMEYTNNAVLPSYIAKVFNFNILTSGAVMTLPYIAQWATGSLSGYLTDLARQRKWLTTTAARKLNNFIALIVPQVVIVTSTYIATDHVTAVLLLGLGLAIQGFKFPGYISNVVDIAPPFSGIIFGFSNTIGSISGFVGPLTAGIVVQDKSSVSEWQILFWIHCAIAALGTIFYLVCGSGSQQPWASAAVEKTEEDSATEKLKTKDRTV